MRIVGLIPNNKYKITVFSYNEKWSVKFETPFLEQTFKLKEDHKLTGFEAVKEFIDDEFVEGVDKIFSQMFEVCKGGFSRYY